MSYKIAIASFDDEIINETFGSAKSFLIYEVINGVYKKQKKESALLKKQFQKITAIQTAAEIQETVVQAAADKEKLLQKWSLFQTAEL